MYLSVGLSLWAAVLNTDKLTNHLSVLSQTERDVIFLLVCGFCISDIANIKSRSIKTISSHKIRAYKKLGVKNDVFLVTTLIGNKASVHKRY